MTSRIQEIKRGQKESILLKEISDLLLKASLDDSRLQGLSINRISLSADKKVCTVYVFPTKGEEEFEEKIEILKLYKPSLRKAIAKSIKGKYVPDLRFAYDEQFEKQRKIEELFERLKKDGQL